MHKYFPHVLLTCTYNGLRHGLISHCLKEERDMVGDLSQEASKQGDVKILTYSYEPCSKTEVDIKYSRSRTWFVPVRKCERRCESITALLLIVVVRS